MNDLNFIRRINIVIEYMWLSFHLVVIVVVCFFCSVTAILQKLNMTKNWANRCHFSIFMFHFSKAKAEPKPKSTHITTIIITTEKKDRSSWNWWWWCRWYCWLCCYVKRLVRSWNKRAILSRSVAVYFLFSWNFYLFGLFLCFCVCFTSLALSYRLLSFHATLLHCACLGVCVCVRECVSLN